MKPPQISGTPSFQPLAPPYVIPMPGGEMFAYEVKAKLMYQQPKQAASSESRETMKVQFAFVDTAGGEKRPGYSLDFWNSQFIASNRNFGLKTENESMTTVEFDIVAMVMFNRSMRPQIVKICRLFHVPMEDEFKNEFDDKLTESAA